MTPPPKKSEGSPASPSFSHNVMDQISSSFNSRRSSGTNFARFAFNIYGGNNPTPGAGTPSPSSNPYAPLANSASSSSTSSYNKASHQFQNYNTSDFNREDHSLKFLSSSEILSFDSSKADPSLVAIGGQRLFQTLRIRDDTNEIAIETDMNATLAATRGSKASAISDLKFGFHQFNQFVAAAATSGNIYLYNLAKPNKVVATFTDHSRTVNTLDFSSMPAQSHCLLSGSQDGTVKLWDLRSKGTKPVLTIHGAVDPVRSVHFSPHTARKLVGIYDSGVIKKYDLRNPSQPERKMNAHTGPGLSVDWHPDFDYIASGGRDRQIQVWNMASTSNDARVPDLVINASGALAKVKWCPQTSLNNIMDARLAASFFGDDPIIQIWRLNRRYVPEYTVESHFSHVTSVAWRTQDVLWSSSKDKTFIQQDLTRYPKFVENLATAAVDWSNSSNGLVFVAQDSDAFNTKLPLQQPGNGHPALPSHTSDINLPSFNTASPSSLSFTPLNNSESSTPFDRPSLSRSVTHKPQLVRNLSNHQQQQLQQQQNHAAPASFLCPVDLPFKDDSAVFEFLTSHYLVVVPEGMDFTSVCEYNAMIAGSAQRFRESQTWKVIEASIKWKQDSDPDFEPTAGGKKRQEITAGTAAATQEKAITAEPSQGSYNYRSFNNSRTNSELDVASLESHSTGNYFGSSPNAGSLTPGMRSGNFTPPHQFQVSSVPEEKTTLETEPNQNDNEATVVESPAGEETVVSEGAHEVGSTGGGVQKSSAPINIQSPARKRASFNGLPDETVPYAFTGSVPDYDDETKGYQSSSAGKSSMSLRSSLSSHRPDSFSNNNNSNGNTWKTIVNNKLTPLAKVHRSSSKKSARSGKSALSRVLRDHEMLDDNNEEAIDDDEDDEESAIVDALEQPDLAPWAPELLVKQSAEYYADQGNVAMAATLALLFAEVFGFKSISRYQAMDWVYTYHDILCRRLAFTTAADILKTASEVFPMMKQKGQTETSLRFYCQNCQKLITNEQSKEKLHADGPDEVDFGYWYCDSCKRINGNCCYCNELMKGMAIATMPCGHIAHFGCYRSWFFGEGEKCCPACGYQVMS